MRITDLTSSRFQRRHRSSIGTLLLVVALAGSGVGCTTTAALGTDQAPATPPTRPADKETCAEPEVTDPGLPASDRVLVPYGPQLLGVEATWGDDDHRLRVISGGYLDDVFEAYDDMEETGSQEIRGVEARLFRSSLMEQPVRAAIWREPLPSPCDAHAVITVGLTDAEFDRVIAGLR